MQTGVNSDCTLSEPFYIVFCVFQLYSEDSSKLFHIIKVTKRFCVFYYLHRLQIKTLLQGCVDPQKL